MEDEHTLFCENTTICCQTAYICQVSQSSTRSSLSYRLIVHISKKLVHTTTCHTVTSNQLNNYAVWSTTTLKTLPCVKPTPSILAYLSELGCSALCWNLTISRAGDWISESITSGQLVSCHDSSYMPDLNHEICSSTVDFFCKNTGNIAIVTAEQTNEFTASNYHDKGL